MLGTLKISPRFNEGLFHIYFPNRLRYPHFLQSSSTATLFENPSTMFVALSPSIMLENESLLIFPRLIIPSPSKQQGITVPFAKIPA